jgi:glycosyltransferase involved in cell wall biosynthesis
MIGTPCYDGKIDVWYVNSLVNTIKLSKEKDVDITPVWVSFDALIQRARNDTIQLALDGEFDDLLWIDSDIEWEPEWFFKLLDYPQDVVGGTYRKKGDKEEYVLRSGNDNKIDPITGLLEVSGLGTGFVKMSRSAMQHLWNVSTPYIDPKDNKQRRMIFDVIIKGNDMISEDIVAFMKLIDGGFKVWLDPNMTCNHTGPYKFKGDFSSWFNQGIKQTTSALPVGKLPQSSFKLPVIPKKQL